MEAKDVKVGMKVVPNDGHRVWSGDHDTANSLRKHGFLIVRQVGIYGNPDEIDLHHPENGDIHHSGFRASDFSPATIEAGDTVRMECDCHKGQDGVVERFAKNMDGALTPHVRTSEDVWPCNMDELTLIRKARKPEQKKEDKPVSKKPRLEEINERYVVKLRNFGRKLAFVVVNEGGKYSTVTKGNATNPCEEVHAGPLMYGDGMFCIVATKQMECQADAIRAVMTNTEPVWDWTEDMDKPAFKVGDWVEVVSSPNGWNVMAGEKGTVCETDDTDMPYRVCGIHGREAWFRANQIKSCPPPAFFAYWYSEKQGRLCGTHRHVNVDGKWIAYTEMSTNPSYRKSNWDDAVVVWEGDHELPIRAINWK
jgi:hypothetical protein